MRFGKVTPVVTVINYFMLTERDLSKVTTVITTIQYFMTVQSY